MTLPVDGHYKYLGPFFFEFQPQDSAAGLDFRIRGILMSHFVAFTKWGCFA